MSGQQHTWAILGIAHSPKKIGDGPIKDAHDKRNIIIQGDHN
jgi:hypothetical protein